MSDKSTHLTAPVTIKVTTDAPAEKPVAKTTAKAKAEKPVDAPAKKETDDAPVEDASVVTTIVGFDGLRAVDTIDGVQQDAREATFAEQVAALAPLILEQAVGIVHNAGGGSVECDGGVVTITLVAR